MDDSPRYYLQGGSVCDSERSNAERIIEVAEVVDLLNEADELLEVVKYWRERVWSLEMTQCRSSGYWNCHHGRNLASDSEQ